MGSKTANRSAWFNRECARRETANAKAKRDGMPLPFNGPPKGSRTHGQRLFGRQGTRNPLTQTGPAKRRKRRRK